MTSIDKQRLAFAIVGGACLAAPLAYGYSLLPSEAPQAQPLFTHVPVVTGAFEHIPVSFGGYVIPVAVTDSSIRVPVAKTDLGRIPVSYHVPRSDPDADAVPVHAIHHPSGPGQFADP